jgi:MSHA biogenesis protein MshK
LALLLPSLAGAVELDPTLPPPDLRPAAGTEAPSALAVQAILRGNGASRAVIDGKTLRVNDEHGGARVLAIYPHAVLIERQGQRQLLHLAQPVVKPSR